MKIEQLRQLVEVAKTKSINQAASNLYISQPNLSLSLRNLEAELGYALFNRNNRGIEMTPDGQRFLDYTEAVLLQFDHLKNLFPRSASGVQKSFSLANMYCRYVNEAASILYKQHQHNDPFQLFLQEGGRDRIIDMIHRGDAEVGIISIWTKYKKAIMSRIQSHNIQYYRLATNPLAIVVGPGNPLYYEKEDILITTDMLTSYPQVMYAGQDYGSFISEPAIIEGTLSSSQIVVDNRAALYEILEHTNAFSIAGTNRKAYTQAKYYPNARSFVFSGEHLHCEVGWIKRRDYTPSPIAQEFIQLLTSYYT